MNDFFEAVETGDITKVQSLLAENPSLVDATDGRVKAPVDLAGGANVRLLRAAAPKSAQTPRAANTRTALHIAARHHHTEIAGLLIAHGANVNALDSSHSTPLHFAVRDPLDLKLLELLVARGADVNAHDKYGCTPLYRAITTGKERLAVAAFILAHGADVNAANERGCTPLMAAVFYSYRSDQTAVIECLIRHGADVNAGELARGWNGSVLCTAIRVGKPEITRLLIEGGADVNARPERRETALHVAARRGRDQEVELLLRAGADAGALDGENRTPLDLLAEHLQMIAILDGHAAARRGCL